VQCNLRTGKAPGEKHWSSIWSAAWCWQRSRHAHRQTHSRQGRVSRAAKGFAVGQTGNIRVGLPGSGGGSAFNLGGGGCLPGSMAASPLQARQTPGDSDAGPAGGRRGGDSGSAHQTGLEVTRRELERTDLRKAEHIR